MATKKRIYATITHWMSVTFLYANIYKHFQNVNLARYLVKVSQKILLLGVFYFVTSLRKNTTCLAGVRLSVLKQGWISCRLQFKMRCRFLRARHDSYSCTTVLTYFVWCRFHNYGSILSYRTSYSAYFCWMPLVYYEEILQISPKCRKSSIRCKLKTF